VVRTLNGDKAPDPHGFSLAFFFRHVGRFLKKISWQYSGSFMIEETLRRA
jgi:hypothetical protein